MQNIPATQRIWNVGFWIAPESHPLASMHLVLLEASSEHFLQSFSAQKEEAIELGADGGTQILIAKYYAFPQSVRPTLRCAGLTPSSAERSPTAKHGLETILGLATWSEGVKFMF